jgi:hypothetical protein
MAALGSRSTNELGATVYTILGWTGARFQNTVEMSGIENNGIYYNLMGWLNTILNKMQ